MDSHIHTYTYTHTYTHTYTYAYPAPVHAAAWGCCRGERAPAAQSWAAPTRFLITSLIIKHMYTVGKFLQLLWLINHLFALPLEDIAEKSELRRYIYT